MHLTRPFAPLILIAVFSLACRQDFNPGRIQTSDALYRASMRQLEARKWDNAIRGFERLTLTLPARDPLMPLSLYHLGRAHEGKDEFLLAAQSYERVTQSFPRDTLADDALFRAARSYARMWRKPTLDAQYGETALATYQQLLAAYPDSPHRAAAEQDMRRLTEWFAEKSYQTGLHYLRRKAYDSAIIYLRDVVRLYPQTPQARQSLLKLVEAFREIRYSADVQETCATLHRQYPGDSEVREQCGAPPAASASPVP